MPILYIPAAGTAVTMKCQGCRGHRVELGKMRYQCQPISLLTKSRTYFLCWPCGGGCSMTHLTQQWWSEYKLSKGGHHILI